MHVVLTVIICIAAYFLVPFVVFSICYIGDWGNIHSKNIIVGTILWPVIFSLCILLGAATSYSSFLKRKRADVKALKIKLAAAKIRRGETRGLKAQKPKWL